MPTPLGISQVLDTPLALAYGGNRHHIMLQATPTADPLVGTTLPTASGSALLIDGDPLDMEAAAFLPDGTNVVMRVAFEDTQRVLRGGGLAYATLITLDVGGTWRVQGSRLLLIDAVRPPLIAYATRAGNDDVLVIAVSTSDATASVLVDSTAGSVTVPWGGLRAEAGARAWVARLPADASGITVTALGDSGNARSIPIETPPYAPLAPARDGRWSLPPWLPQDATRAITAGVLAAAEAGMNDLGDAHRATNPTLARERTLDLHGRTYGVPRLPSESDDGYRARVLAVPRGMHLTRDTLEAHLTRVAGGARVRIIDATSQRTTGAVQLDGTHQLDGTWQLGGSGADLPAGEYIVAFDTVPLAPLDWILAELHRLRPVGTRPRPQWTRAVTLGIANALMGARDIDANPPLSAYVVGAGDIAGALAVTRPLAADADGAGDITVDLDADAPLASVSWIEVEFLDLA